MHGVEIVALSQVSDRVHTLASCAFDCTQNPDHMHLLAQSSSTSQVVVLPESMQAIYTVTARSSSSAAHICTILRVLSLILFAYISSRDCVCCLLQFGS